MSRFLWFTVYIEDTSIMSKNKGSQRITESFLLAPLYDNDVSSTDSAIMPV